MTEEAWMRQAIALSRHAMLAGQGGPFGAVIVHQGQVIAEGNNQVLTTLDPTAHAEVVAIRRACQVLQRFNLADCVIYTSCEPCPMCLGAIYWSRLAAVVYANTRADAALIGFDDEFFYEELAKPLTARKVPMRAFLREEAYPVFQEFLAMPGKKLY
jgi:tRNA(Arg) A34 adenosine deaminase TadA